MARGIILARGKSSPHGLLACIMMLDTLWRSGIMELYRNEAALIVHRAHWRP